MSASVERSLRFVEADEYLATASHWQTRSHGERLQAVFALHSEGNALFKGGNPPLVFTWELRHVDAR